MTLNEWTVECCWCCYYVVTGGGWEMSVGAVDWWLWQNVSLPGTYSGIPGDDLMERSDCGKRVSAQHYDSRGIC
jgi:hypothetical protein